MHPLGSHATSARVQTCSASNPSQPPQIVRPHLVPPMLGALCSHPMLRLANWDPWRPMEEVIAAIKAFVEAHGRVVGGGVER